MNKRKQSDARNRTLKVKVTKKGNEKKERRRIGSLQLTFEEQPVMCMHFFYFAPLFVTYHTWWDIIRILWGANYVIVEREFVESEDTFSAEKTAFLIIRLSTYMWYVFGNRNVTLTLNKWKEICFDAYSFEKSCKMIKC